MVKAWLGGLYVKDAVNRNRLLNIELAQNQEGWRQVRKKEDRAMVGRRKGGKGRKTYTEIEFGTAELGSCRHGIAGD